MKLSEDTGMHKGNVSLKNIDKNYPDTSGRYP